MKVGIIGGGAIARSHIRAYRSIDEVDVIVLADISADFPARTELESEPGGTYVSDYKQVIRDGEIDIVSICLPHDLHARFAIEAIEAGKDVITEKPIALNTTQADNLLARADQAGRGLHVVMNLLFTPYYLRARELLRGGTLGTPFLAVFHIEGDEFARMNDPQSWKGTPDRAGGGAMIDTGYHAIYMLLDLFGMPERVSAHAKRLVVEAENKMDDNAVATLEFPGGVLASVIVSYTVTSKPWSERRHLYCTEGSIEMADVTDTPLKVWKDGRVCETQDWPHEEHPHPYSIGACIRHYVESIQRGSYPMVDARHARATLATIEAIYQASETGLTVDLGGETDSSACHCLRVP